MAKISGRDVLARVKRKQNEDTKVNVTFRLKSELLERFRNRCEKEGVSMTAVIEELMSEFLS